ncbi:hypothetical protein [Nocardiopsis synnemataformans]|uniref:hypothetical protein n=1 Tax=Nocardiopsis synnemataformans TaxID=61305 RepID=UPI003EB76CD5
MSAPCDGFGSPIDLGDTIITTDRGYTTTPPLLQGRVVRFTPSKQIVEYEVTAIADATSLTKVGDVRKARIERVRVLGRAEDGEPR